MHITAAICFLFALFFYSFAWSGVASGLAVLGIVFETAAWVVWLSADRKNQRS